MKRVALYISSIGTGGIESCSISQFVFMDKTQVDVEFLVDSPPLDNFNVKRIRECGGKITCCFNGIQNAPIKKLLRPFVFLHRVRKGRYDVIHFHISNPTALFYALICKCFTRIKVIVSSHAQGVANRSQVFVKLCAFSSNHLSKYCDKRYADSVLAGKWMFGNASFEVMVNGIDIKQLRFDINKRTDIRASLGINKNTIVIGHVGRFSTDKNHRFIISVFKEFTELNPASILLLIGKGELKESIVDECKKCGVLEKVRFIESVPLLAPYYSAMDLFLFPSLREGFGLVALEAQAASLPVLASLNVPGETKQTNLIQYLNLDVSAEEWSKTIQGLLISDKERIQVDINSLFKNCDIRSLSERLVRVYNSI